jgi:16S rRNA (uracil1498-N3)-methyltransferase
MRTPRLFIDQSLTPQRQIDIDGAGAQYLSRVLRARVGHQIALFDGSGSEFPAEIIAIGKRAITVLLGEGVEPATESPIQTSLGLCLSKGDRFDWAVQKATELGVSEIQPLVSERVDFAIPEDRIGKRVAHWQQIAVSACEQSGRVKVPRLHPPTPLLEWVRMTSADEKWVLDGAADQSSLPDIPPKTVAVLVGPEGGLTDGEVSAALGSGFRALRLGPRILRTETAPAVALTLIHSRWGDLHAS